MRPRKSGKPKASQGSPLGKIFLFLILVVAALYLSSLISPRPSREGAFQGNGQVENPAPYFDLPSYNGGYFSPANFSGRRALLVFSSTNDPAFLKELPLLLNSTPSENAALILVVSGADQDASVVYPFAKERGLDKLKVPILLDLDAKVSSLYSVGSTPHHVLLDEGGNILRTYGSPFGNAESLNSFLGE